MTLPLSYNWRNIFVRRVTTGLTILVVAVVVVALVLLLSFGEGIRASVGASGRADNILVLNSGATAESTSLIFADKARLLVQTPGIALDATGRPLVSEEMCVQTDVRRKGDADSVANVAVRGVDPVALEVHSEVQIIAGRVPAPGTREAIVGKAATERYAGLAIGDSVKLGRTGNHPYQIVGIFSAAGGAFESEIWAPRSMIADSYVRRFSSAVVLRLRSPAEADAAMRYANGPTLRLKGARETDYYHDLSQQSYAVVELVLVLVLIMGVGAIFAVTNTMYSAVDARRREIAVLRTIGFSRAAIILSFLIESTMICGLACILGIATSFLFSGIRQDVLSNTTWTVTGFEIRVTPLVCAIALIASLLLGVFGALAPAWRASKVRVIEALRKA